MKYLFIAVQFLLIACAQGGGSTQKAAVQLPTSSPNLSEPTPTPTPTPPITTNLTYYSKTTVQGIPGGYVNYTGSCVVYMSETYCWDDGEKIVTGSYCSFWQVSGDVHATCTAGNKVDSLLAPAIVDANMLAVMTPNLGGVTPTQVLSSGTPTSVVCTLSGNILNCVDFSIDLSQVPL